MKTARVLALLLVLTTVGCDRVTKHLATETLADKPGRSYLSDTVRLEYVENPGAFLGLGSELPEWARSVLLTAGAGVGLLVVAVTALKLQWTGAPFLGAVLIVAGGFSNLIDRVIRGSVVDFMNVGIGPLRTGIFNVADVALMAGVVLIALGLDRRNR